jgi:predicted Zn-dependent peptidase
VNISFEEYDLANGLHVILHVDRQLPIVAINLWYHVGSKNERDGKTGFAHLFEHMMFQGSANVPANGHFAHVQKAGGTLNASTSFDRTNYYETLPSHQLALGLWLEADRMRSLNVNEQTLETQRSVVMEERRTRYDNQPYGTMYEELFAHAYKVQSYRWPTIGSMNDIASASLDDVRDFHAMYYRPDNASLCLAGDFDPDEAMRLIEEHFGNIPRGGVEMYRPVMHEPVQMVQVRDFVYDAIPAPGLIVGMHIPEISSVDFTALDLLAEILSSGQSSRLYRKLVYEARAALSTYAFTCGYELPGLFVFRSIPQQGRHLDEIERRFWNELSDIREYGVTNDELFKAQNRLVSSYVRNLSSLDARADLLNSFRVIMKDTSMVNSELARIQAVTTEDMQYAARTWLCDSNATVLHYLPFPNSPVSV